MPRHLFTLALIFHLCITQMVAAMAGPSQTYGGADQSGQSSAVYRTAHRSGLASGSIIPDSLFGQKISGLFEPGHIPADRHIKRVSDNGANKGRPAVANPTAQQLDAAGDLGVDPRWVRSDGSIDWPSNSGFDGSPALIEIQPGARFDRYGGRFEDGVFIDGGHFVSPSGVPFEQRALPASSVNRPYQEYQVILPIPDVNSGSIAPWFGQPGGGIQYQLPMSIDDLVQQGFIRPVFD